jgi:hypothetical protein
MNLTLSTNTNIKCNIIHSLIKLKSNLEFMILNLVKMSHELYIKLTFHIQKKRNYTRNHAIKYIMLPTFINLAYNENWTYNLV